MTKAITENIEIIYPDDEDEVFDEAVAEDVAVSYMVNFVKCEVLIYAFPFTKP